MYPVTAQAPVSFAPKIHSPSPGVDPNNLQPGVLPSIANLINPPQQDGTQQQQLQQQNISTSQTLNQQSSQFPAPPQNGGPTPAPGANFQQSQQQQQSATMAQQPTPSTTPQSHQSTLNSRQTKGKYSLADFEIQRTLGTGSFGRVHLVQSRHNQRFYAVKVLKKAQVVKMKQVEHTNDERKMLGEVKHPFLITLWGTFQDSRNLYMVMDFVEGGELFSLLRKSGVCLQLKKTCRPDPWDQLSTNTQLLLALSQPGRQILCCRGHPSSRIPTRTQHYLPRLEAGESVTRSTWSLEDYRFWLRKEGARQDMDAMWYT